MDEQMHSQSKMCHLFSTYLVWPRTFDADPYSLPQKYQYLLPNGPKKVPTTKQNDDSAKKKQPSAQKAVQPKFDDFEMVEAPQKKKKPQEKKPVEPVSKPAQPTISSVEEPVEVKKPETPKPIE